MNMFSLVLYLLHIVVSRTEYDAFLHYLVEKQGGGDINWGAAALQKYSTDAKEEAPLDFRNSERDRKNFVKKASRYHVLRVSGHNFLSKLEKVEESAASGKSVFVKRRVICHEDHEALWKEFHDKRNHLGYIKCYYEVSTRV